MVKDEKHFDKFDRAFESYFKGWRRWMTAGQALIPEDWLRKEFEKPDRRKNWPRLSRWAAWTS
jgi:uncharacterized protein with von Willebrand factor type A (vWA) domain